MYLSLPAHAVITDVFSSYHGIRLKRFRGPAKMYSDSAILFRQPLALHGLSEVGYAPDVAGTAVS